MWRNAELKARTPVRAPTPTATATITKRKRVRAARISLHAMRAADGQGREGTYKEMIAEAKEAKES
jgi:hypothetical protein